MKKIESHNGKYSYSVYVDSKGIYYISNEWGTRRATKKEILEIKKRKQK